MPLEHAGLSDRLAAAVGFARAEGVAAAAEISAHGLVSAFVAALAPIGRVHESKVRDELRRAAAGGADDEIVRLAREEALRLGVLLPLQRAGLDENLEALSAALLVLQAEGAAASDVTPCGLEDDRDRTFAAGTLGRASQQRARRTARRRRRRRARRRRRGEQEFEAVLGTLTLALLVRARYSSSLAASASRGRARSRPLGTRLRRLGIRSGSTSPLASAMSSSMSEPSTPCQRAVWPVLLVCGSRTRSSRPGLLRDVELGDRLLADGDPDEVNHLALVLEYRLHVLLRAAVERAEGLVAADAHVGARLRHHRERRRRDVRPRRASRGVRRRLRRAEWCGSGPSAASRRKGAPGANTAKKSPPRARRSRSPPQDGAWSNPNRQHGGGRHRAAFRTGGSYCGAQGAIAAACRMAAGGDSDCMKMAQMSRRARPG